MTGNCDPALPRRRMTDNAPRGVASLARSGAGLIVAVQTLSALPRLSATDVSIALVLGALSVGAWTVVIVRRRGDVVDQATMVALIGLGAWLHVLTGNGQVYVAAYGSLFVAPLWYGLPRGIVPTACGVLAVWLCTTFVGTLDWVGGIGNALGAIFFGMAAWFWGRVLREADRNAALVAELQESRAAEHRNAVAAERARLGRELHDVLAHTLSSLSLHLESTRVLARSRDVDAAVQARLETAVGLARTGLEEARDAVATLRDDALPGPDRLQSLVTEFTRTTGVEAAFEQVGTPQELTPEARVALFRSAQEALTNVGKHAGAQHVEVCLRWDDGTVTLRVADDGHGGEAPGLSLPGGGNGLRGMRERAELAGGSVSAGPAERGFCVELSLPA